MYMIQICSGITGGRVLNGELYAQRLHVEVNLSAFAYRLFHEDFSSVIRAKYMYILCIVVDDLPLICCDML